MIRFAYLKVTSWLCASALALLLLVSACTDANFFAGDTISADLVDVERVDSVTIRYSDSAKVKVVIIAPLLLRINEHKNNRQEFTQGVEVQFLNPDGSRNSVLTADYGIRYESSNSVVVQGNVIWSSIDGKRLESEELIWDEQKKKIHTQKLVHIVTPEQNIFGYGLEADQDFNNWSIIRPIGDLKVEQLKN